MFIPTPRSSDMIVLGGRYQFVSRKRFYQIPDVHGSSGASRFHSSHEFFSPKGGRLSKRSEFPTSFGRLLERDSNSGAHQGGDAKLYCLTIWNLRSVEDKLSNLYFIEYFTQTVHFQMPGGIVKFEDLG
ncbi:hypothetical protein NPIL_684301 [Nephila pilipes]|uniref:Uncharacterized protein n=1 Tax=Nephila pilipes TaxID=299642 RepID=A0A8X6NR81_NEPPI|nr:hypothetical protein NPIL_684301 [Nephila pilipes]